MIRQHDGRRGTGTLRLEVFGHERLCRSFNRAKERLIRVGFGLMFLAGVLGLSGCFASPPASKLSDSASDLAVDLAGGDLVVMSFNIRNGRANDGENSWPNRRALVSAVIRESDADVIGLQEAFRFQLDALAQDLPHYHAVGQGRAGGTQDEYSAILYRTSRFDLIDSGTFWLSDTPEQVSRHWGNALLRVCTWAHLRDRRTNRAFYTFNTHWDHSAQIARVNSANLIRQRIADRAANDPVIVVGDMNAGEDNPAITLLKARHSAYPLVDTFRVIRPDAKRVGTFNGGYTGRVDGAKIDYILTGPGFETVEAWIDTARRDGRYASDHYPVIATVRLQKPGD